MYVSSPEYLNGWEATIVEQSRQIQVLLQESPSLKPYFIQIFPEVYVDALDIVSVEYKQTSFPAVCPFNGEVEAILSTKYY